MPQRYRTEYDGEFVIVTNRIINGKKEQEREWIDNPIENQHISGRAAVIGDGQSRYNTTRHGKLNLKTMIEEHSGWHLGRKRLQSYGAEGCWREMQCDFYVEFDQQKLQEIKEDAYQQKVSVYTNARNCIDDPGEYFLVPYGVRGKSLSVALWLSCFDGHKEIFMLGCDALSDQDLPNEKLINEMNTVMLDYPTVKFYYISDGAVPHSNWRKNVNFNQMKYKEFISYCDIGT